MAKDTFLNRKATLNCRGRLIDLSTPSVMAILNLTPDSFYGNSRAASVDLALKKTAEYLNAGARFIDLGAYSSRPGAVHINETEELVRLMPVVEALVREFPDALFSIDTFRAKVALAAIEAGAHLINDISAGALDTEMFATVARLQVPYLIMHMKGTPQNMQDDPTYTDVTLEVLQYFEQKMLELTRLGVTDLVIDPGFGFAKTMAHNYTLLHHLDRLAALGFPILVGVSRKSMITRLLGVPADEALNGTTALNTIALLKGASILRVHDVKEAMECIRIVEELNRSYPN